MKLHDLKPQVGSKKQGIRVGRGTAGRRGKTGGRGTKGQGARAGKPVRQYNQGGNLPFYRRLPFKRGEGFTPLNRIEYNEINLDQLSKFPAGSEITPGSLAEAQLLRKPSKPVVILGRGELKTALKINVHRITSSAKAKVEAAGGSVEIIKS
ncbi:MAG: 50S ribosomal protein L15 [Chloroflexi bacterium RBG_13_50_21]|nr:MAG: 50S ribosomal protein L15 [Chloroflexi bacterium RBG_13_50_21]